MHWRICSRSPVLQRVRFRFYFCLNIIVCLFVLFVEVEKQLQGSEPPPIPLGTPHMSYKKSHSGSTGNIHGLVGLSDQQELSVSTKLSTFSAASKNNLVQMRRTTNKKGKQAPAPPKRTRFVCVCANN